MTKRHFIGIIAFVIAEKTTLRHDHFYRQFSDLGPFPDAVFSIMNNAPAKTSRRTVTVKLSFEIAEPRCKCSPGTMRPYFLAIEFV